MEDIAYEFQGFRLHPKQRRLTNQAGDVVPLPPRAFDTLVLLVERAGELFDKRSLMRAVWGDIIVEQNSLDQIVSLIRRALCESAAASPFLATERGRGYRFVADVIRVTGATAGRSMPALVQPLVASSPEEELLREARALVNRPSPSNLRGALELLNAAIEQRPTFAHALAERALLRTLFLTFDVPMENALVTAEQEARQALLLDAQLARAHQALGYVLIARGAWVGAKDHIDAACRLESSPQAQVTRVFQFSQSLGYLRLSLEQATEITRQVPYLPLGAIASTAAYTFRGLNDDARRSAERASQLGWPRTQAPMQEFAFLLAVRSGDFREAEESIIQDLDPAMLAAGSVNVAATLCSALQAPKRRNEAAAALMKMIADLRSAHGLGQRNLKRALVWLTMLGALDEAFETLHRSLDLMTPAGTLGNVWGWLWAPEMLPFRRDARFQGVIARFGFMDYWKRFGAPDGHELCDGRLRCLEQRGGEAIEE